MSSSLENRTCLNDEVIETPIRSALSPSKTVRFEIVENADSMCTRNRKLAKKDKVKVMILESSTYCFQINGRSRVPRGNCSNKSLFENQTGC